MTLKSLDARISKYFQGHKVTGVSKKCLFVMIRGIFADYTSRKRLWVVPRYGGVLEMPQKVCEGDILHVMAFARNF